MTLGELQVLYPERADVGPDKYDEKAQHLRVRPAQEGGAVIDFALGADGRVSAGASARPHRSITPKAVADPDPPPSHALGPRVESRHHCWGVLDDRHCHCRLLGLLLLALGGDSIVKAVSGLAQRFGASPFTAGLLLLGVATSLPELAVNARALAVGQPELALGNAVGSSITNLGLTLAVAAMAAPLLLRARLQTVLWWSLLAAGVLLILFGLDGGRHVGRAAYCWPASSWCRCCCCAVVAARARRCRWPSSSPH